MHSRLALTRDPLACNLPEADYRCAAPDRLLVLLRAVWIPMRISFHLWACFILSHLALHLRLPQLEWFS